MRSRNVVACALAAACALAGAARGLNASDSEWGASSTPAELLDASRFPLSTSGPRIVDKAGRTVKLACVNWYGSHMELFVQNVG
jgi:hypothetical protein